ncbi:homoserine dehydrogenase [bacterium]|nr:homoserine dehydrogenase [bacterium]MBU1615726.1 homoserine dehydrogenase [bacterium]
MVNKVINIGLIGLGTVGTGVVNILSEKRDLVSAQLGAELRIKKIADLNIAGSRDLDLKGVQLTTSAKEIISDPEIEIVIELIGGYEPARSFILTALRNGKHVVTANKALLARHWDEIILTAKEQGAEIGFEASVAGGIPLISSLTLGLCANKILSIYGIINGTCNYILTKMAEEGEDFEKVLAEAQAKGFAESDPALDIEGIDSAHKIAILASLSTGQFIKDADIYQEGISRITHRDILYADEEFGLTIKLLGIVRQLDGELDVRVHPTMIPKEHLLSQVKGVFNAVYLVGDSVGPLIFYGQGAGELPTASAVVADVIGIAHNIKNQVAGRVLKVPFDVKERKKIKDITELRTEYYLRLSTLDQPGVLAKVSGILGRYKISLASVIQKERSIKGAVPLVMLTHHAKEANIKKAVQEIDRLSCIKEKSLFVRIERLEEK